MWFRQQDFQKNLNYQNLRTKNFDPPSVKFKNPKLQQYLSKILGHDYKIMHKKFVLGVPRNFIPKWITKETDNVRIAGLNSYVKPEYRNITYFHGIDFHMDLLDHKNLYFGFTFLTLCF